MLFDLHSLIDPALWALADESRAFYATRQPGRGPGCLEELHTFRSKAQAAVCDRPPTVEVVSADGRDVPVRIHMPDNEHPAGVVLEIHTGGFYFGSAAGSDLRNRRAA